MNCWRSLLRIVKVVALAVILASSALIQSGCGYFAAVSAGGPLGEGKEGNHFDPSAGIDMGFQQVNKESGTAYRIGAGYRTAKNIIDDSWEESETEGHIITPLFGEVELIPSSFSKNKFTPFGSLGMNWNMITLKDADGYNNYFSPSIGGGVRLTTPKSRWSVGLKCYGLIGFDLEQAVGLDVYLMFSPVGE